MSTPDPTPASNIPFQPKRYPKWMPVAVVAAFLIGVFAIKMILPPQWHARLELKNTGTKAVTIVFKEQSTVTKPGEIWKGDFRASDTISIHAGESIHAPSHTLTMPAKNPKPWTPSHSIVQHWTADVNADDPQNIRIENRRYTEVTMPPSPWEPWP
ncbi:hypothetical protein [Prosthecobacter sp.]|uniref:hypothetical protein n=1 Tax=Prosthecobacter sp. TaxID=1965333 RepID=UPI002AB84FBF|nr:hypothetical protein [Prosthecobacter sp.]MDZ4401796.1 hypothetical protein [Prosthecobacter sp.]